MPDQQEMRDALRFAAAMDMRQGRQQPDLTPEQMRSIVKAAVWLVRLREPGRLRGDHLAAALYLEGQISQAGIDVIPSPEEWAEMRAKLSMDERSPT